MEVWNSNDDDPGVPEELADWESFILGGGFLFVIVMACIGFAFCIKIVGGWMGWL